MGITRVASKIFIALVLSASGAFSLLIALEASNAKNEITLDVVSGILLTNPTQRNEIRSALETGTPSEYSNSVVRYAVRAPMDAFPYEVALVLALSRKDGDAARVYAEAAMLRQPRSLTARLYLFNESVKRQDFPYAIHQYERLIELRSLNQATLSDALIGVFRDAGNWRVLVDYLRAQPASGKSLMIKLVEEKVPRDDLESILLSYPDVLRRYLDRLTTDGSPERAFALWRTFAGVQPGEVLEKPFNPEFRTREEPPPFNWKLSSEWVESHSSGGIDVTYLGNSDPLLAAQYVKIAPGTYTMRTIASGELAGNGGRLEWRTTCSNQDEPLSILELQLSQTSEPESFESLISVPSEACSFVVVELRGVPGEFPKPISAHIHSVMISDQLVSNSSE